MELVRHLPASDAASGLARPAVDLALGRGLASPVADDVRRLADELLTQTGPRAGTRPLQLRVRTSARSVHVEVRWEGEALDANTVLQWAAHSRRADPLASIDRLADRWGLAEHDGAHCLWAEKAVPRR